MDGLDQRAHPLLLAQRDGLHPALELRIPEDDYRMSRNPDERSDDPIDTMFTNSRSGRGWKRQAEGNDGDSHSEGDDELEEQFTNSRNGKGFKRDDGGMEEQFTNSRNGKGFKRDIDGSDGNDPDAEFTNSRSGRGWKRDEEVKADELGPKESFANTRRGKGLRRDEPFVLGARTFPEARE